MDTRHDRMLSSFVNKVKLTYFMSGDIIIKQNDLNNHFYFIHKGLVEVCHEHKDFIYFDHNEVINHMQGTKKGNFT